MAHSEHACLKKNVIDVDVMTLRRQIAPTFVMYACGPWPADPMLLFGVVTPVPVIDPAVIAVVGISCCSVFRYSGRRSPFVLSPAPLKENWRTLLGEGSMPPHGTYCRPFEFFE